MDEQQEHQYALSTIESAILVIIRYKKTKHVPKPNLFNHFINKRFIVIKDWLIFRLKLPDKFQAGISGKFSGFPQA